jgi:hypothetical protein
MAACCSKARARAKRQATIKANRMAAKGITPKKAHGKKATAKQATAKKAKPCKICGNRK